MGTYRLGTGVGKSPTVLRTEKHNPKVGVMFLWTLGCISL